MVTASNHEKTNKFLRGCCPNYPVKFTRLSIHYSIVFKNLRLFTAVEPVDKAEDYCCTTGGFTEQKKLRCVMGQSGIDFK
jgi:hypothetical protein